MAINFNFLGFWGWECHSYIYYLLGMCPASVMTQTVAGEDCKSTTRGMYLIKTNSVTPFALGRLSDVLTPNEDNPAIFSNQMRSGDPFQRYIDEWGKLEGTFNNIETYPTPFSQDPNGQDWPYFNHMGSNRLTNEFISRLRHQHETEIEQLKRLSRRPTVIKKTTKTKTNKPMSNLDTANSKEKLFEDYKKNSTLGIQSSEIFSIPKLSN